MVSVADFKRNAASKGNRNWQQWITGSISDMAGLGQGEFTYLGCDRHVKRDDRYPTWHCRKRIGPSAEVLPNEIVNHRFAHRGECVAPVHGIQCFGCEVTVSDGSARVRAEVWAPAMHILGCPASVWLGLDNGRREEKLKGAYQKQFDMLLMSVHAGGIFAGYKVQFVRPEKNEVMPIQFHGNINSLSASLGSLGLGYPGESDSDVSSQSSDGHDCTRAGPVHLSKVKHSLRLLLEAHHVQAAALKHLQRLVDDLQLDFGDSGATP